jgi:hypothetical protein
MEGYIYMIYTNECMIENMNVFKVGRTQRHYNNRLAEYSKNSKPIVVLQTDDCIGAEKFVLQNLKEQFLFRRDLGLEYFEGDEVEIRECLEELVNKYNESLNNKNIVQQNKVDISKTETKKPSNMNDTFDTISVSKNKDDNTEVDKYYIDKNGYRIRKCNGCGKEFNKKYAYDVHKNRQKPCNIKQFKCDGCGNTFTREDNLKTHVENSCKKKNLIIQKNELKIKLENALNALNELNNIKQLLAGKKI